MATECDGGVVRVREEGILDDDTSAPSDAEHLDEVLEEEECCLPCLDREVLLDLGADFSPEWRIREDDIMSISLIDIVDILSEGIGVSEIGCLDAVEDHIHRGNDIGERLYFFSIEGFLLDDVIFSHRAIREVLDEIPVGLTEKSC